MSLPKNDDESFISFAFSSSYLSILISFKFFLLYFRGWIALLMVNTLNEKKMLTKVTLKEFMRILPQVEFAIKRLVNLKNHYSSMLFGTWKKVFKSACLPDAGRLLHNRCNLMAPIKKFFQLRFFFCHYFSMLRFFFTSYTFSKPIFIVIWCGDFPLLSPPLLLIHFWPLKCCGLVIFHGRSLYEFGFVKIFVSFSCLKRAARKRRKKGLFIEGKKSPKTSSCNAVAALA